MIIIIEDHLAGGFEIKQNSENQLEQRGERIVEVNKYKKSKNPVSKKCVYYAHEYKQYKLFGQEFLK